MNKIDAQSWKADMPDFREKTKAFYNGEMSKGDYKGYSGRYGSYAQKDGKASMLRLRMPAGRVTKEKLAFIAEAIRKYNVKKAHFTTCETIQLHDLQQEELCRIMEDAVQCRITKEMIMDILDKENVVIGSDLYTQIIVSVDKESNIGVLYVISLSCPFLLSHLLDNVVRNQLLVVDSENHIVGNLYEYMLNRWSIRLSGTPKSYVTIPMEKSAVNDQQLASLLMSETMYEEGEEFGQLIDKDIVKIVSEPYGMAQYDIAYVGVNLNTFIQFFPSYRGSKQYRLFWNSVTAFYIELILFEEAAVTRFNKNLVDLMAFANKDAPEIFLEKNRKYTNEYLTTVEFWNVQLNYPSSQKSIQMIRDAFNEKALLSRMERYQNQVKNIFEINKELIDREAEKQEKYSNDTMNLILFILTIVSTVSAIYQIVDYVVDYRYQSAVKNSYSVIANVIAMIFIIVVFLVKRKKRNHTDKKW